MIYAFYGQDTVLVRDKAHQFIESLKADGQLAVTRLAADNFTPNQLTNLAGANSLFGTEQLIILDTLTDNNEAGEELMAKLDLLAESANQFVLIETTLSAGDKRRLGKCATEVTEIKSDKKTAPFKVFSLTDALLRRDKKSLWLLLTEATRNGLSGEEIIGVLWWQLKTLRLASLSQTADAAGLKPFVYNKAKSALSRFTKTELENLSDTLLQVYHDGHSGRSELDLALEAWVLKL